jgi:hypothetical protein
MAGSGIRHHQRPNALPHHAMSPLSHIPCCTALSQGPHLGINWRPRQPTHNRIPLVVLTFSFSAFAAFSASRSACLRFSRCEAGKQHQSAQRGRYAASSGWRDAAKGPQVIKIPPG